MVITTENIHNLLQQHFPHFPTKDQQVLLQKLASFLNSHEERGVFIVKGYAGTGKTSMVKALVKTLPRLKKGFSLLAPTGRAAKVMANYSGAPAFTIHKKIYRLEKFGGQERFVLNENKHKQTVFIVDEASMISGRSISSFFGSGNVLDDLIHYVYHGLNCKLIFIGDTAQLPPVHTNLSPALNEDFLQRSYFLNISSYELKEVVRQEEHSGILYNATALRNLIAKGESRFPQFKLKGFADVERINGMELEDALNDAYGKYGAEETMVVCRSNKRANLFNQQIRARIRWQEDEVSTGDYIMIVKNNYFWIKDFSDAGFIANGDIVEVQKVTQFQELYGFHFAEATIRLVDYPNEPELEVKLLLDTIMAETPSLSRTENKRLFQEVMQDYQDIPDRRNRMAKLKNDPYFNALQVKFAYAVTCHKSQGGQWKAVFIDQGYLTEDMLNLEFLRWLYTAVTRATEKLYLVNFNPDFFAEEDA